MAAHVEEKPEGAPEWMVSFADMITIMMSFFVIMFALASGKNDKQKQSVKESIEHRFGPQYQPFGHVGPAVYKDGGPFKAKGGGGKGKAVVLSPTDDDVAEGLRFGKANIGGKGDQGGLGGSIYFEEFSADLSEPQKASLKRLADRCAGKPQKLEIMGHASKQPLPPDSPFHDHWDLAYARSRAVGTLLTKLGIEPQRLRMGVAGDTEPVYRRDPTAYARKNSRVDVYMLDILVSDFEPPPEDTAASDAEPAK
jgi:chemotaxis protein MotB